MSYSHWLVIFMLVSSVHYLIFNSTISSAPEMSDEKFSTKVQIRVESAKKKLKPNFEAKPKEGKSQSQKKKEAVSKIVDFKSFFNISPDYPYLSRVYGESGVTTIQVVSDGKKVEEIIVKESSGYERLDQAAVKAIQESKLIDASKTLPKLLSAKISFQISED